MIKKHFKENLAITLVSLAVTIIVLLILAGITIGVISGENGLVEQAKKQRTGIESKQNSMESSISNLENKLQDANTVKTKVPTIQAGDVTATLNPTSWTNR